MGGFGERDGRVDDRQVAQPQTSTTPVGRGARAAKDGYRTTEHAA